MQLGQTFQELRRPTFRDLAREAECSYSLVLKVVRGERRPNVAIRRAFERLWDLPASKVFGNEVARHYSRRAP